MAFYIFPPKATLSISKLELYTRKRLDVLVKLSGCHGNLVAIQDVLNSSSTAEASDSLIEGSTKDAVSHFALRLACSVDPDMCAFFRRAECTLFFYRVSCMNATELKRAVKPLERYQDVLLGCSSRDISCAHGGMKEFLDCVTELMPWETLIDCYAEGTKHSILIPWHFIPKLVAQRMVTLHRGDARVGVNKLPDVLKAIFEKLMHIGTMTAQKKVINILDDDGRVVQLCKQLQSMYRARFRRAVVVGSCELARHEHVDELSQHFPPCMKNLHQQLRRNHRLSHHDRITYTLFLKEVGLPIHEALQFWRHEYSQPATGGGSCKHSWVREEKRYTYNVRHLYGLEGSRINYRGHSCLSIQNHEPSPSECGGCPFKHFDLENLGTLLHADALSAVAMETIATTVRARDWSGACALLFAEKKEKLNSRLTSVEQVQNGGLCFGTLHCEQVERTKGNPHDPVGSCEVQCKLCGACVGTNTQHARKVDCGRCNATVETGGPCGTAQRSGRGTKRPHDACLKISDSESGQCIKFSDSPYKDVENDGKQSRGLKRRRLVEDESRCCGNDGVDSLSCKSTKKDAQVLARTEHSHARSYAQARKPNLVEVKRQPIERSFLHKPIDFYRSYSALLQGLSQGLRQRDTPPMK